MTTKQLIKTYWPVMLILFVGMLSLFFGVLYLATIIDNITI